MDLGSHNVRKQHFDYMNSEEPMIRVGQEVIARQNVVVSDSTVSYIS